MPRRIIVIGAGPTGLAAALDLIRMGAEVTVLEGHEVGHAIRSWGPTRFFTPLEMNITEAMGTALGAARPPGDAMLTGLQFADGILRPVAATLGDRVLERHRVLAIGRRGFTRTDHPGHPLRVERPFRLLVATPHGEKNMEADVVLDATGNTAHPMPFGNGGLPAPGESKVNAIRSLGELEQRRAELAGKRLILVGHGHSAATALPILLALEGVHLTWVVRTGNRRPCEELAGDPLPERHAIVAAANGLASCPPANLAVQRRAAVDHVAMAGDGGWRVRLTNGRELDVDQIVALTGYRPDDSYIGELEVEVSPVTEGSAALHRRIAAVTDCLSVPAVTSADFATGEPGFHFIGARAYGRNRNFLLRTGYAQLGAILPGVLR